MKKVIMIFKKSIVVACAFLLSTLFWSGCKEKGCTDPRAINYNSVADEDDGSCVVCQSTKTQKGMKIGYLIDTYWQSQHYEDTVALFYVMQYKEEFNNTICGSENCGFSYYIESLVNQEMEFNFNLQSSGGPSFGVSGFITIAANTSTEEEYINPNQVFNDCLSINTTTLFVNTSSIIVYH